MPQRNEDRRGLEGRPRLQHTRDGDPTARLQAHDGFEKGSRVDVVVDPDGLVHPMLAQRVQGAAWSAPMVIVPLYLLQLLLCWLAAKPRKHP